MITILIFIAVLSVLVFVHEFGHFFAAKRAGMKVEEFGFGFPPRLWGVKRGGTVYSINLIPFGGFVKIFGESGEEEEKADSFVHARPGVRALVIVAGVVMNFVLAMVLLSVGNYVGLRVGLLDEATAKRAEDVKIQIIQVAPGSPADLAGLRPLDEVAGFLEDGGFIKISSVEEVQGFISDRRGEETTIRIKNGAEIRDKKIIPRLNPPEGEGALGISLAATGVVKYPLGRAILRGITDSAFILEQTVIGYATLIKNALMFKDSGIELSGPVGIAVITGKAAKLGFAYLMQFVALISINLAVLNIIPFPALDGGRLLFLGMEKLRGRPVSRKIENAVNAFGFALLILLMLYVTTKDVAKFFNF